MKSEKIYKQFMAEAISLAMSAESRNEVPVGALIVKDNEIIGKGFNLVEKNNSAVAHAEITAIKEACTSLNSWRLVGCTIYSTREPCAMCAGAIILSRISKLVFGTSDPKTGAVGSVVNLFKPGLFNHDVEVVPGILQDECKLMLSDYFSKLRASRKK